MLLVDTSAWIEVFKRQSRIDLPSVAPFAERFSSTALNRLTQLYTTFWGKLSDARCDSGSIRAVHDGQTSQTSCRIGLNARTTYTVSVEVDLSEAPPKSRPDSAYTATPGQEISFRRRPMLIETANLYLR